MQQLLYLLQSITMLQRSLGHLPPLRKRAFEKRRASKRESGIHVVPLVFKLPHDILEIVWSLLTLSERLKCIQVCKTWRSQLLGSPVMWSELSGNLDRRLKRYNIRGNDIRRVNLNSDPNGIDFLLDMKCANIQSLSHVYIPNRSVLVKFHKLLRFTGHALKSLHVDTGASFEDILSMIFEQCLDLTQLRLFFPIHPVLPVTPSTNTITADSAIAVSMKRVVDLDLYFTDPKLYPLTKVLPLFTGLRDICISSNFWPNRDWLTWIDETFPAWQSMRLGERPVEEKLHHTDYRSQGCKAFACGPGWVSEESLLYLLEKYGSIMSAFQIRDTFGLQICWIIQEFLIDVVGSNLRSLVLVRAGATPHGFDMDSILDRLPCLEHLVLWTIRFRRATEVSGVCLEHPNRSLKSVRLVFCHGNTTQNLQRLVSRFHPSMQLIWFNDVENLSAEILDSIADNVSSLDMFFLLQKNLTSDMVQRLADKWQGKRLNSLTIRRFGLIKSHKKLQEYVRRKLPNTDISIVRVG
ncbi:hypothetical protein BJV82DRAFT_18641 [Fennellomyces sp. T-0311]|nr:hypothetical protein BJV82DRAFT_18641 [Fennellomyces sp. T-0311]